MTDVLRTVSGIQVIPSGSTLGGNTIRFTRTACTDPRIYVDDLPILAEDLDQFVAPDDIAGIEVYNSAATLPPRYARSSNCGVVIVWTR